MMHSLKTLSAAAGLALIGTVANAATVAEITTEGEYVVVSDGSSEGIGVEGSFTAFLDTAFDITATNTFLFELDFAADGIPDIDEELLVPGITGEDILIFAFGLLSDIDLAFPDVLDDIIGEVIDGDSVQRELGSTGIWLGFEFEITDFSPFGAAGTYEGLLSDGELDTAGPLALLGEGAYAGSATVSTVPLPATLPLLAFGGAGLMALGRRRKAT